jgi:hypothetical protein
MDSGSGDMSWSVDHILALRSESQLARRQIALLFRNNVVHPNNEPKLAGWGQYLNMHEEGRPPQHGIYGTTAGIQVLALHDYAGHRDLIEAAVSIMPDLEGEESEAAQRVQAYFEAKGDSKTIYKMASVAEALAPTQATIYGNHPIVDALLRLRLHEAAWGDYFLEDDPSNYPNTVATATALIGLSRYDRFRRSPDCQSALEWLCNNVDTRRSLSSELALALYALTIYHDKRRDPPQRAETRQSCIEEILERTRRLTSNEIGREIEFHEYFVPARPSPPTAGAYTFRYMFYLPHCLMALALMYQLDDELNGRSYILNVVSTIVTRIRDATYFSAARRTRASSVDHLWIYRLLTTFEQLPPQALVEETFAGRLRSRFFGRRILAVFGAALTFWSLVWLAARYWLHIEVNFLTVLIASVLTNILSVLIMEALPLVRPRRGG